MGVEAFLVNSSVNLVCAQRLVRRICEHCREPHPLAPETLVEAGFDPGEVGALRLLRGRGCERCGRTGYRGRIGLFEVMEMTEGLRQLVIENAPVSALRRLAIEEGMVTLRQSGLRKVRDGLTTLDEVVRETIG
jgi:type IV pilus assembly protein PilB